MDSYRSHVLKWTTHRKCSFSKTQYTFSLQLYILDKLAHQSARIPAGITGILVAQQSSGALQNNPISLVTLTFAQHPLQQQLLQFTQAAEISD